MVNEFTAKADDDFLFQFSACSHLILRVSKLTVVFTGKSTKRAARGVIPNEDDVIMYFA